MLKRNCAFFGFSLIIILCAFSLTAKAEIADQSGLMNGYHTVYELSLPTSMNYSTTEPAYSVDNTARLAADNYKIEKIGYYFSLKSSGTDTTEWVGITMDAFTSDYTKMGVPTFGSGAVFQQYVTNMAYKSNAAALNNGTINAASGIRVKKGNIEFWPNNYNGNNALDIPNAQTNYDFGDTRDGGGNYGSMQIHDHENKTVVMAINNWNGGGNCMGIGNNTQYSGNNQINPDWTFANTASVYSDRQLGVYVKYLFDDVTNGQRAAVETDSARMERVYQYEVSQGGNTPSADFTANVNSLSGMPIDRVGYYYRLTKGSSVDYAYVSYDALDKTSRTKLGIPEKQNFMFQTGVKNMTVYSNVANVENGTGLTGNVEIWSTDYATANGANVPGADGNTYDFGDTPSGSGNGHGSFQIHNTTKGQTVIAYNNHRAPNPSVGIGNNLSGHPDWTFITNGNNYDSVTLDVLASPAIAPMMAEATNGSQYSVVQGLRLTTQMETNWNSTNTLKYDIVDNAAAMKTDGIMFDRIGYYIEYAPTYDSELHYAFVSMDAFTDDIAKIGVPNVQSGIFWQRTVKNLEVSTNVPANEGIITAGKFHQGYLEFWPSNYGQAKGNVITAGSGDVFDINDSGASTAAGHGSMQVHNLDKEETVFSVCHFNGGKSYGAGTNPKASTNSGDGQRDWTFDYSRQDYKIANIYTFVRESDAVLTLDDSSYKGFYQRHDDQATVTLAGSIKLADGASFDKIQVSSDGTNWTDLDVSGTNYSGSIDVDSGWHYLDVRAVDESGKVMTSTSTNRIGVGDIFITAGQSNSTNCGDAPQSTVSGNVVSLNLTTGKWDVANDPQPVTINGKGDGSNRGSTWPAFGDALSELTGVPVGIVSVGWSGSSVQQWNPDNVDTSAEGWDDIGYTAGDQTLYGRLALAIQELDGDFTGVLWHQGESNRGDTNYASKLESLIEASWQFANENFDTDRFPWMVALVSANGNEQLDDVVREQQLMVINNYDEVFQGPDSDLLLGDYRGLGNNHIHFSELGLLTLGQMWALQYANDVMGIPEPSTWALLLIGVGILFGFRERKRHFHKNLA
ncbi:MAG: PEP-CTERM sorting domain-containing protein [Thermoguttaceae bacterium]|nr:PEP-CTERM sorting domain-containing protein [Thermoguttaceae bacterium]